MLRMTSFTLLLALLMGGVGISSAAEPPGRKAQFCPECWRFLNDPWDLDLQGRCAVSGKQPVTAEAVTLSWTWCRSHHVWHRRPCGKDFSTPLESSALLIPAGSEVMTTHAYCPGDRMISDIGHAGLACPVCGRPFVAVDAVERRWFWCRTEKGWLGRPCPSNATLRCCSPRSGTVLAFSWQPPFLNEVSARGPGRPEMRVDADWLAAHLDDPHLVVLHVGFDPAEPCMSTRPTYFDGHIRGARQVAWAEIAQIRRGIPTELPSAEKLVQLVRSLGIDWDDRIVLYDTCSGLEAARAYVTLDYLGLGENAALLDGHWARWKAMKFPQSQMPEEVEPSAFVPRLRPEILVSFQAMKDLSWLAQQGGSDVALLDARSGDEFSGLRPGRGILRGGHIAGASNLCWMEAYEPVDEPILRAEPELRALFEAAGARPGRRVVTYCRTGIEASLLYFAAKYLGYEAKLYDGSYFEWSRDEEMPVQGPWAQH